MADPTTLTHDPTWDVAHLAHIEILSPRPEESVRFFVDLLGLSETDRCGQSVYLRAWGDFYHHTLKVTESAQSGLGHLGWRTTSQAALERRARALADTEWGQGWSDGDVGHGPAYRCTTPDGHHMELFFAVDKIRQPAGQAPLLKNQPEKIPLQGAGVRRLDHVNLLSTDVTADRRFLEAQLGMRLREQVRHGEVEMGCWLSVTPMVHDVAIMKDSTPVRGRFHHVAYWLDSMQELIRAADILREYQVQIEVGPGRHAITNGIFLYLFEPGGNRVELFTGGYLIFDPDWEPVIWTEKEADVRTWWGGPMPTSFFSYGTPPVPKDG